MCAGRRGEREPALTSGRRRFPPAWWRRRRRCRVQTDQGLAPCQPTQHPPRQFSPSSTSSEPEQPDDAVEATRPAPGPLRPSSRVAGRWFWILQQRVAAFRTSAARRRRRLSRPGPCSPAAPPCAAAGGPDEPSTSQPRREAAKMTSRFSRGRGPGAPQRPSLHRTCSMGQGVTLGAHSVSERRRPRRAIRPGRGRRSPRRASPTAHPHRAASPTMLPLDPVGDRARRVALVALLAGLGKAERDAAAPRRKPPTMPGPGMPDRPGRAPGRSRDGAWRSSRSRPGRGRRGRLHLVGGPVAEPDREARRLASTATYPGSVGAGTVRVGRLRGRYWSKPVVGRNSRRLLGRGHRGQSDRQGRLRRRQTLPPSSAREALDGAGIAGAGPRAMVGLSAGSRMRPAFQLAAVSRSPGRNLSARAAKNPDTRVFPERAPPGRVHRSRLVPGLAECPVVHQVQFTNALRTLAMANRAPGLALRSAGAWRSARARACMAGG